MEKALAFLRTLARIPNWESRVEEIRFEVELAKEQLLR